MAADLKRLGLIAESLSIYLVRQRVNLNMYLRLNHAFDIRLIVLVLNAARSQNNLSSVNTVYLNIFSYLPPDCNSRSLNLLCLRSVSEVEDKLPLTSSDLGKYIAEIHKDQLNPL